jgi:hypothetical protein
MSTKQTQGKHICEIKLICIQKEVTKKSAHIYPSNFKDTKHQITPPDERVSEGTQCR